MKKKNNNIKFSRKALCKETGLREKFLVVNGMIAVTKNFLCITHTVEHNYISPSSTVGTQLHVSALYVGHLQVVI